MPIVPKIDQRVQIPLISVWTLRGVLTACHNPKPLQTKPLQTKPPRRENQAEIGTLPRSKRQSRSNLRPLPPCTSKALLLE